MEFCNRFKNLTIDDLKERNKSIITEKHVFENPESYLFWRSQTNATLMQEKDDNFSNPTCLNFWSFSTSILVELIKPVVMENYEFGKRLLSRSRKMAFSDYQDCDAQKEINSIKIYQYQKCLNVYFEAKNQVSGNSELWLGIYGE